MILPQPIEKILGILESYIPQASITNNLVSTASVSWHIAHTLKVLEATGSTIQKTNPADYQPTFSFLKLNAMLLGRFPRGKAKAPKFVLPEKEYTIEELQDLLATIKAIWSQVPALPTNAYIKHHLFGHLNKKNTIRFAVIHTMHHVKIVRDILKK
ncbi:MAG: hypothetical protein RL596_1395 [Bacteroidota bacterium]|jgi:hypothetical protein